MATYEFIPESLMQRRPSPETANPLVDGAAQLDHERAHWAQLVGTTFGALTFTLRRAAEFALFAALTGSDCPHRGALLERLGQHLPLEVRRADGLLTVAPDLSEGMAGSLREHLDLVNALTILMARSPEAEPPVGLRLDWILERAESTYAAHTGSVRPWNMGDADRLWSGQVRAAHGSLPTQPNSLTTRHLLESHALVNELASVIMPAWEQPRHSAGTLSEHASDLVRDRFSGASELYTEALETALRTWRAAGLLPAGSLADDLTRATFTFAACIDIALNPPVPPNCPPTAVQWTEVSPPMRFLRAVDGATKVGLLGGLPSVGGFMDHRDDLCVAAHLQRGEIQSRSFQHPRLTTEYFSSLETPDELLFRVSYFDFLVFVSETTQLHARSFPFSVALPWATTVRHAGGEDILQAALRPWRGAPYFWEGDALAITDNLADVVGVRLLHDLLLWKVIRCLPTGEGVIDLRATFPPATRDIISPDDLLEAAARNLGSDGLGAWEIKMAQPAPPDPPRRTHLFTPTFLPTRQNHIAVRRVEVEGCDLRSAHEALAAARRDPIANAGSLSFSFSGYWYDAREIWEIAAVMAWVRALRCSTPDWAWYFQVAGELSSTTGANLLFICDFKDPWAPTKDEALAALQAAFQSMNVAAPDEAPPSMVNGMTDNYRDFTLALGGAALP